MKKQIEQSTKPAVCLKWTLPDRPTRLYRKYAYIVTCMSIINKGLAKVRK